MFLPRLVSRFRFSCHFTQPRPAHQAGAKKGHPVLENLEANGDHSNEVLQDRFFIDGMELHEAIEEGIVNPELNENGTTWSAEGV